MVRAKHEDGAYYEHDKDDKRKHVFELLLYASH